jgi:hypothetical protein
MDFLHSILHVQFNMKEKELFSARLPGGGGGGGGGGGAHREKLVGGGGRRQRDGLVAGGSCTEWRQEVVDVTGGGSSGR